MYAVFFATAKEGEHMKILVFSDSHGMLENISSAFKSNDFDAVIFLGDGLTDLQTLSQIKKDIPIYAVRGNCDFFAGPVPEIMMPELNGKKIFMTHGHLQYVKSGIYNLKMTAKKSGAHAVLYGHTHLPFYEEDCGLIVANPGSALKGCYAVMTIDENIKFEFKNKYD